MALLLPELKEGESYPQELIDMGSRNHSYLQGRIFSLLDQSDEYVPFTELSLDVSNAPFDQLNISPSKEMKPDVCVYRDVNFDLLNDEVRMTEMPILVIEILSPLQGAQAITEKFPVYFALGVQSCWMVAPAMKMITVYTPNHDPLPPVNGMVIDEKIGIQLSLDDIFKRFRKKQKPVAA